MPKSEKESKSFSIFWGFFFYINLCIGNGFLNFPFTFTYSGLLAAVPTLIFLTFVSWTSSNYVLEVMVRAQALELVEKYRNATDEHDDTEADESSPTTTPSPKYDYVQDRKYEISELCEIFFNKHAKYIYLVMQALYIFSCCWSYTAVVGSSWAINIPFYRFKEELRCSDMAFLHRALPQGGCLYAYYWSVGIFAIIAITLSLMDLKEQAAVQMFLGLLRFFTITVTSIYSIYRLVQGGDACLDYDYTSSDTYGQNLSDEESYGNVSYSNIAITSVIFKFDPKGWLQAIPIILFANMYQLGIPSLSHPIRQKKYLHYLTLAVMAASFVSYMCIGVILPLWFRATIEEVCTLNWAVFTHPGYNIPLRIFSYYLVFFPSLDVLSTFPLTVHIQVNSIYHAITGRDTSEKPIYKYDWLLRLLLRFTAALLPILAALGLSNLAYVLKGGGFLGLVCYQAAFLLQVRSIYVTKEVFGTFADTRSESRALLKSNKRLHNGKIAKHLATEKDKNNSEDAKEERVNDKSLYMTPYSFGFFSQPLVSWIMVVVGFVLYVLTFIDFFFEPDKLSCIAETIFQNETYY